MSSPGIKRKRSGFTLKGFVIPALLTVLFIIAYTFVLQKNFSDETLRAGIERNTIRSDATSELLAGQFTAEDFTEFLSEESVNNPRYLELQSMLNGIRRLKGVRYLYTAGYSEDGTLIYIVDGLEQDAEDFASPGTAVEEEMIPYIEAALSGKTVYSQSIVDTAWGHIYTACYPITVQDGDIIGALCIETDMESIYESIAAGMQRVVILAVIAAAIVVLISVLIFFTIRHQKKKELAQKHALQSTVRKLREREVILEALSIDYDSVYFCDLTADTLQIIKENPDIYTPEAYELLGDKAECYSVRIKTFFENFVEQETAPDLTHKLSAEYLTEYLSDHSHMTCRYKVKPNPTGHVFEETKIVPVRTGNCLRIVMGSHYIDDIMEDQERQKSQLEEALFNTRKNSEIISAIARIYKVIYYLDLTNGRYEKIAAGTHSGSVSEHSGRIDELADTTLRHLVAPDWQNEMKDFLNPETIVRRLDAKESINREYEGVNGHWYRARIIIKNRSSHGHATEALYVAREVTDEKKQELEYQQRLKESAEEAARANASKTDFLRRMSHDVRTPINGIRGMIDIANYYPHDIQKQQECRDKIWNATNHLLSLVNNILDMNKLESGRITLQHDSFDLCRVLCETDSISEMQAIEHNIRYIVKTDQSQIQHSKLLGSKTHLKQILLNFTSNAVKYNREGGSVTVCCSELSCDGKTAVFLFTCIDTGIGMSEEFMEHAFEPFMQEEKSDVNTHYAGSGLGLSIAKQLVELMGGTIELKSKDGFGTTVQVTLPFDLDPAPSEDAAEAVPQGVRLDGINALLAEDNELNAEIAQFTLEKYGMKVKWVENGRQAVEAFEASKSGEFDVIFMDVMMPVMSGLDAARCIRAMERPDAKTIPIFAMTANAFTDDIQRSYDAGMNEHLTKPLQESEIIGALRKYAKLKQGQR